MNACIVNATRCTLGSVAKRGKPNSPVEMEADVASFLICFCGSGTGHMTQALTMSRMLTEQRGMKLTGVVTDSDASPNMIEELIKPLQVPLLILPAITIVNKDGVLPPHQILGKAIAVERDLRQRTDEIRAFLAASRASVILSMWQISLGKFLMHNPLPASVRVLHIAAQFALASLSAREMGTLHVMAAVAKGTIDVMASVFAPSGRCIAITGEHESGASGASNGDGADANVDSIVGSNHSAGRHSLETGLSRLAPMIEIPAPIAADCKPLLLCYFLTIKPARKLERLLHRYPIEGVEVHVFTPEEL
uniref:Uncharacterized protein n=1 Tax=Haptolina brevifila TaxID=156173 RepID=A0A7S2J5B0_9EUKA|mmetsp:Transcript_76946/g.152649  ORF Transcript_76946/g.152649 Transcript_76946/m.152649 type:complete len:307 (+) Transcript_76946:80-1000(+)|eukprot:CAMPEP_0174738820 /NCGR_PEP_ID=MMETSP1094-20130205/70580_1 /TAXON_ID=156173 /ORGANISM="Chrysochromulina brevifilum, Strain UTEX LB 985" /LENGTH=306 /DNA_ID=CAMNT_0015942311 /DNA_START=80 /DNA_END=1000 /DNA_ORIENTATION=+